MTVPEIAISVFIALIIFGILGLLAERSAKHGHIVGDHYNGRCWVCGGSIPIISKEID